MKELSPLHKFILRNTDLLPIDDQSRFLGVSSDSIRAVARSMGLPDMEVLPRERAFPLVVRRNHDLLSEESLAHLLGMPLPDYRKAIQEMDFLDVKVGPKPEVLPDILAQDERAVSEAATEFNRTCAGYFNDYAEWEKPFSFINGLSRSENQWPVQQSADTEIVRIMYSYTGTHGDFLLTGEDFYSEGILSRLRNRGVNAAWMPVLLRDMAPSSVFAEFGEGHETRIENLRKQVRKALEYGIRIYLYINEPRFLPDEFFDAYPAAKGMEWPYQERHSGMCTSDDGVRKWLFESTHFLFSQVPDLGGVVIISASENRTNCYSHRITDKECPKCACRGAEQVLADTANIMFDAVRASGSKAEIVQWLWGWDFILTRETVSDALSCLSPGIVVMVDWARYTPFEVFGKQAEIIEYTLAYTSPSDYARGIIETAKSQGRKVFSRCAIVTTVEMNALPYLPVLRNVENLLSELKAQNIDGFMGSWIFGAYPGRNMEMLLHADDDHPAQSIARKYYGRGATHALAAWESFSSGMEYLPTTLSILYLSALNPGPGLKLRLEPEPWRHGMVAMASEKLDEISDPLGSDVMIRGFREVAKYFDEGLTHLQKAIDESDSEEHRAENIRDFGISKACMLHFKSVANYSEFVLTRNRWLEDKDNAELSRHLISTMEDELQNAEAMLHLAKSDSRIGYEGSIGYFYTPVEIIEKIYDLKHNLCFFSHFRSVESN